MLEPTILAVAATPSLPVERPRLVCVPAADREFDAHANALLAAVPALPSGDRMRLEFEHRLQMRYPGAVVRPREPLAEPGIPEIVWYVTNRPFRGRLAATVEINAPREKLFATYVERFAEWQASLRVRPVRLTPKLAGSQYTASYELFGRTLEGALRLVEAEPPDFVRYEASGFGGRLWFVTKFRPMPAGTRVEVTGDYELPEGAIPKIADRLVIERLIQRDIDASHERLRRLCEGSDTSPSPG
jgi:polyketide cyclase/dehydrase/lipid transport protein